MKRWIQQAVGEGLGVFALVFVGAGSILVGANLIGVAFAHGLAIAVMVSALIHVSGGHINPAVTLGALVAREIEAWRAGVYWLGQSLGGILGAAVLLWAFPGDVGSLGTPALGMGTSLGEGILVETVLTFFLVFVVFGTVIDPRHKAPIGGLAIGLAVTMDVLMGGPLTGAAMNHARWLGPALVTMTWTDASVWLLGPTLGGILAGLVYGHVIGIEPDEP